MKPGEQSINFPKHYNLEKGTLIAKIYSPKSFKVSGLSA